jgi:hypothetical protein
MPVSTRKHMRVGDEVHVRLGPTLWRARIIENRGPIGVGGRRLYRVQLSGEPDESPQFVEVPEEDIQVPAR